MVLLLTIAYSKCANGAGFKSEEELIDETRANIEKHLNDKWPPSPAVVKQESVKEAPKMAKEEKPPVPTVEDKPAPIESPAAVEEDIPSVVKEEVPSDVTVVDLKNK
jgi:hypothetical protein